MAAPQIVVPAMDIRVHGQVPAEAAHILTPDALRFVGYLHTRFELRRQASANYSSYHFLSTRSLHAALWKHNWRPEALCLKFANSFLLTQCLARPQILCTACHDC
jgi:hypothetical protein